MGANKHPETAAEDAMQITTTQPPVHAYAEFREVTSVVSEQADIVPQEVLEGLIIAEYPVMNRWLLTSTALLTITKVDLRFVYLRGPLN